MTMHWIKSILTTLALALGLAQLLSMAQLRGWIGFLPIPKKALLRLHRWGGIAALAVVLLVLGLCLYVYFDQGWTLSGFSLRLLLHAILGALATLVLLAKVVITNRLRRLLRWNTALGIAAGLLLLGLFLTSALWHFIGIE